MNPLNNNYNNINTGSQPIASSSSPKEPCPQPCSHSLPSPSTPPRPRKKLSSKSVSLERLSAIFRSSRSSSLSPRPRKKTISLSDPVLKKASSSATPSCLSLNKTLSQFIQNISGNESLELLRQDIEDLISNTQHNFLESLKRALSQLDDQTVQQIDNVLSTLSPSLHKQNPEMISLFKIACGEILHKSNTTQRKLFRQKNNFYVQLDNRPSNNTKDFGK